ncbi:MAG: hypothetical protein ACREOI_12375 [bacterium]
MSTIVASSWVRVQAKTSSKAADNANKYFGKISPFILMLAFDISNCYISRNHFFRVIKPRGETMTELVIKTEPEILDRFKTLSQELYHGDETKTFTEAVLALISFQQKRDPSRLQALVDKIRADIESRGGLSSAQIDKLVRESRKRRRAASQ